MLNKALVTILSLGFVARVFAVAPGLPVESLPSTAFAHSVGHPWTINIHYAAEGWAIVDSPANSTLTEMANDTAVTVRLNRDDSEVVSGVYCNYTLSDGGIVKVKNVKLEGYCGASDETGLNPNFTYDPIKNFKPTGYRVADWLHYIPDTPSIVCNTSVNAPQKCNWDKEIRSVKPSWTALDDINCAAI